MEKDIFGGVLSLFDISKKNVGFAPPAKILINDSESFLQYDIETSILQDLLCKPFSNFYRSTWLKQIKAQNQPKSVYPIFHVFSNEDIISSKVVEPAWIGTNDNHVKNIVASLQAVGHNQRPASEMAYILLNSSEVKEDDSNDQ